MADLELLKVGHCFHPEAMVMKGHPWKPMLFPAIVGLLRHPSRGPVLFDTGYAHRFLDETRQFPNRLYRMLTPMHLDHEESLLQQLQLRGIGAEDIRYIFISHFHADHVSGLKDFPSATFLCSRAGLEAITSMGPVRGLMKGYLKNLLPADFAARVRFIEDCEEIPLDPALAPFARGHDLFGDGGYFAVSLPGHAHGHMGLLAEADRGPHISRRRCDLDPRGHYGWRAAPAHRQPAAE